MFFFGPKLIKTYEINKYRGKQQQQKYLKIRIYKL